jgi:hypothetical protein
LGNGRFYTPGVSPMLSIQECKQHLKEVPLDDKQIEELRNQLYLLAEVVIQEFLEQKNEVKR